MATHSSGISALQLQKQLGIGSYRSAWLLAHKNASMVDPERNALSRLVEIDDRLSLPSDAGPKTILPPWRARTQPRRSRCSSSAPSNRGRKHRRPPAAGRNLLLRRRRPPGHFVHTARRSRRHRDSNRRLVRLRCASPPIATMSMSSGRPPLTSSCRGSTKSSPTSKDGREASTTGCVASICRPISMVRLSLQPPQNPPRCFPLALPPRHQCRTPYLQHVDRTGAMCIERFSGGSIGRRSARCFGSS